MELSPLATARLTSLLADRTGHELAPDRRWRLATALRPVLHRFALASLDELAAQAADARGAATSPLCDAVVDALLNHETSFFRDRKLFTMIAAAVLPALAAQRTATRRLRLWSAGCATGQEAWSLAMLLLAEGQPWAGWSLDLLATDVSPVVIATARAGRYTQAEVQRGLAVGELLRWFEPVDQAWQVKPALAARVRLATHNLLDPAPGRFDLVLCRNTLLYLPEARRAAALSRLADAVVPGGVLILGAGETLLGQSAAFVPDETHRGCYLRRAT